MNDLSETKRDLSDHISRQAAIDALSDGALTNYQAAGHDNGLVKAINVIKALPSAQPEITEDDVKEYCRKRCLIVVTSELYYEMAKRWSQQERILCRDCKKYDSHDHRCKVWNHGIHTDDWCSRAERRTDG